MSGLPIESGYIDSQLALADDAPLIDARPPWAWSVAVVAAFLSVVIVAFLFFGRVESVVRVRGMVLPVAGITAISSERGGVARRVLVQPGQTVKAGDPLVVAESSDMVVGRAAARESLRFAQEQVRSAASAEDAAFAREIETLERRRTLLVEQSASLRRTRELAATQVEMSERMERSGLLSRAQATRDRVDLETARRLEIANRETLASLSGEMEAARARHAERVLERQREIGRSMSEIRVADIRAGEEVVKAPSAGVVDTVLVREGETIQGGQMLVRLAPVAEEVRIICYVPERERRRIRVGTEATIKLDQFKDEQRFRGRVVRIGELLAVREEVDATVGRAVPVDYAGYRVEISVFGERRRLARPGMLGDVKIRVGAVRPGSLLFGGDSSGVSKGVR